MGKLKFFLLAVATTLLCACSGSDNTIVGQPAPPGGTPTADIASVTVLTSRPQIDSDGSSEATITALVRDSNNSVVSDIGVVFSASSGSIAAGANTTDATGTVTATLSTGGDPTARDVTVTAIANGNVQDSVTVVVSGVTVKIDGAPNLPLSDQAVYTVTLTDAPNGTGIGNTAVNVTSSSGNSIDASPVTTNASGQGTFTLTANNGGADTLTAEVLGTQFALDINVSPDAFSFTSPAPPPAPLTEVNLGDNLAVEVLWEQNGVGVANRPVTFTTTRGTLSAPSVNTDASGAATVTVSATTAGPALLTATNDDGTDIQVNIEFVATTPSTLELQANPFTVPTSGQSFVTAIVRDVNGNLVKNQTVSFVLTDSTNGFLSVAQSRTGSQGQAQTTYNASSSTSSVDGVRIDAQVQGFGAAADTVFLTVAQQEVFISIGTGNKIDSPNTAQYRKEWVVQVTDAQGNGVDGVNVSMSVLSERYWDGVRAYIDPPGAWLTRPGTEALPLAGCMDEDVNRNGTLNVGEDANGNSRIEAGNIATAVAQAGGGSTVTTDVNGFALVDVYWPQEFSYWLEVTLEARTSVQGTEFAESTTFVLPGATEDFTAESTSPPGLTSPFGTDGSCATPPPPDGP